VSYQGINKHYFSASHHNDLCNALFKRKTMILEWISEYEKGKKAGASFVPIYFKSPSKCYTICYPCKYLGPNIKEHKCNKMGDNCKKIKDILTNMTEAITAPFPPSPCSSTPSSTPSTPRSGDDEVTALKKRIDILEKREATNKKIIDRAMDTQEVLWSILSEKQTLDFESFTKYMTSMKKDYPEVFAVMYRDLGGEEGKEDEYDEVEE